MAAEMRERPVLTEEDSLRFIEREQQVNIRRKEILISGKTSQIKKGFTLCTSPVKR